MTTTRSRTTDPATSKAAGEQVELRASQARVLNMFKLYGDMHDKQLLAYLNDAERAAGLRPMSPSGARSRRSELAKPNMDRLDELAQEALRYRGEYAVAYRAFERLTSGEREAARILLRAEGFRSKLWDTGKREIVDGRTVIVWGIAG